jgi:hypothetical protein
VHDAAVARPVVALGEEQAHARHARDVGARVRLDRGSSAIGA